VNILYIIWIVVAMRGVGAWKTSGHNRAGRSEMKVLDDLMTIADLVPPDVDDIVILGISFVLLERLKLDRIFSHIPNSEVESIFNPCPISKNEVEYEHCRGRYDSCDDSIDAIECSRWQWFRL
jgi:hypothetical protein